MCRGQIYQYAYKTPHRLSCPHAATAPRLPIRIFSYFYGMRYYFVTAIALPLVLLATCPGYRRAFSRQAGPATPAVIRINELGYTPSAVKVAVWAAGQGP